ncbi:MAG: hypothetical protein VX589_13705 [Myxococcota bacterium]|nr:hypothetical protein [Myxococcota bacterium]
MQQIIFALSTLFALACAEDEYLEFDDCREAFSGQLELGTGTDEFEAAEGNPFVFTAGFQGGYHLYGGLRLPQALAGPARIAINLCQNDRVIARARLNEAFIEVGEHSELAGILVVLLQGYRPENRAAVPSVLTASVEDKEGGQHRAALRITPACCIGLGQAPE